MPSLDSQQEAETLASLLAQKGLNATDFVELLEILGSLKKTKSDKVEEESKEKERKIYKDKEFVFDTNTDIFIYRRGETKGGNYYVRIYDNESKRVFKQSLKTSNKHQAHVAARMLYQDKRDKLVKGIKMKSITTSEMIKTYLEERSITRTHIPHKGITHKSFEVFKGRLKYWDEYIKTLKMDQTKIEKIPKEVGNSFRYWMLNLPKTSHTGQKSRSNEVINHTIYAIKQVYKEMAVKKGYITLNEVPDFECLKIDRDQKPKRDILEEKEYIELTNWMNRSYAREKGIPHREMIKRRIFALFFSIHYNLGARNKEMLGLRWRDVSTNPLDDEEGRRTNRVFYIDASNSKTGKSRNIVAKNISPKLDRILSWYKKIDIDPDKNDFIFINLSETKRGKNVPIDSLSMERRLKYVMEKSGMNEKIEKEGRHITLYSARHFYATARLMRGVNMSDLALNMGTSINYIEQTYSHLTTLMRSDEITKGQGIKSNN